MPRHTTRKRSWPRPESTWFSCCPPLQSLTATDSCPVMARMRVTIEREELCDSGRDTVQQIDQALQCSGYGLTPYLLTAAAEISGFGERHSLFHYPGKAYHSHR